MSSLKQRDFILNKYTGRGMKPYFEMPGLVHKRDILRIEGGISEIDKIVELLNDGKSALVDDWQQHLTAENVPKPYATEQEGYFLECINVVKNMIAEFDSYKSKLIQTLDSMKIKLGCAHVAETHAAVKRKLKENKHHVVLRKQRRIHNRAHSITLRLGRYVVENEISPEITGNAQIYICVDEMELLESVLNAERKDAHLIETLNYINTQGLFHISGWECVQQWLEDQ